MDKVRYAVVGAGWISQIAFMPAVSQTDNSVITAIITGNAANAAKLAAFYDIKHVYHYDDYDATLASGQFDAVYIGLPNSLHADYTIRALKAGIHAIVEPGQGEVNREKRETRFASGQRFFRQLG